MLSNKLTFSLVLVLVFALATITAMAQISPNLNPDSDGSADGHQGIGKDSFVVFEKNGTPENGVNFAGVEQAGTDNFPDIDNLLQSGGTIELLIRIGDKGSTTHTVVSDAETIAIVGADAVLVSSLTAGAAAKTKHRLIISEIMWGRNRTATNAVETLSDASQWIEVYNHGGALKAGDDVRLRFHDGKVDNLSTVVGIDEDDTDGTPATNFVVVDSVSLVNSFSDYWAPKGNGGNTAIIGSGAEAVLPTPLNSMYRKVNLDVGKYKVVADGADKGKLDGLGLGTEAGSWEKSVGAISMDEYFIGSPGSVHVSAGGVVQTFAKSPGSLAGTGVTINEVRNDTSEANLDWVELFNNTDPSLATSLPTNIENWTLSITTRTPKTGKKESDPPTKDNFDYKDDNLFSLPKYKLQPGDYLVVYNRDPGDTILAGGVNLDAVAKGEQVNKGASHMYVVRDGLNLPSDKKFTLILRNGNDKKATHEKIVDFAGSGFFKRVEANAFNTDFWPFIAWPATTAQGGDNTFASANQSWGRQTNLNANGVYWPDSRADDRGHGDDWQAFEAMGGVGYDRDVDLNSAPGTPGYANVTVNVIANDQDNAAKTKPYAFSGMITISEIMYDAGPRWNLIQWIELYNSSMTETINLKDWTMEIRNKEDVESYVDSSFEFGGDDEDDVYILPNQTLLLVSGTGANDVDNTRVYNLYQHHRRGLGLLARDSVLLSRTGFYLKLTAKVSEGGETKVSMVMDEAGNVMIEGAKRTVVWELPARDPDARQSLVRQFGTRAIDGTADAADDGTMEASWTQSDVAGAGLAYYGHRNDVGTPGFRLGGPLPVSLSSFRPLRDKATGEVIIRWITQSELNNAGFNILRADSKDGEFKVINLTGIIAGHGTTSEKHVYSYVDKTAKPNVAYYYQIEDVSLNGHRTTLQTTHMRGNVNASGKLTTTWSNLKFQK